MRSRQKKKKEELFFFLLINIITLIIFIFSNNCRHVAAAGSANEDLTIPVTLYYETLCPYCSKFIVDYLSRFFSNGLIDVVDLRLLPYGNARVDANGTIQCQHGPYECLLNTVEACAIDLWPEVHKHFPMIKCVEDLVLKRAYSEWETCFSQVDLQLIANCYNTGYGKKLELLYGAETDALQPAHKYVPWVVVNEHPLYEDYENVTSYVCRSYQGPPPEACKTVNLGIAVVDQDRNGISRGVCYADDKIRRATTAQDLPMGKIR